MDQVKEWHCKNTDLTVYLREQVKGSFPGLGIVKGKEAHYFKVASLNGLAEELDYPGHKFQNPWQWGYIHISAFYAQFK